MYYKDSAGDTCEAKRRIRIVNGKPVTTWECDIVNANILEVEAGTNGYCGGDTDHGSRTYFRIKNCGDTDMQVNQSRDGFSVALGGDSELMTIKDALRWILSILEVQSETDGGIYGNQ